MPERTAQSSDEILRAARFSPCGRHRLLLERHWAAGPLVGFVMLNPSTADAERDDPTIRRCVGFARSWGFGGLLIANLFTLRATDPRDLARAAADARNVTGADAALTEVAARSVLVVEAWGAHRAAQARAAVARQLLAAAPRRAVLARTRDGAPSHPLYLLGSTRPVDAITGRRVALPLTRRASAGTHTQPAG